MFNFNLYNVINVIVSKTSHYCYNNNRFKNAIIIYKIEFIIIIVNIAINEKDIYFYDRFIFLYFFQLYFNLIFRFFIITPISSQINITSLSYSSMHKQLI